MKNYDIIVIGAGVAGMTSALNILRNGKNVLIIEQSTIGGQIAQSPRVDNYPTVASASGEQLGDLLLEQVTALGAELEIDTVLSVNKDDNGFVVECQYDSYSSDSVIIASGVMPRKLALSNEDKLIGNGVSYCAMCDGAFYKDKEIALLGDGNTALQYAIFLSNLASKVHICTLDNRFMGDKSHQDIIATRDNVVVHHCTSCNQLLEENGKLTAINLASTNGRNDEVLAVSAVFVAIGQVPNNGIYANLVELDRQGYIVADETCTTKTAGLFVAGDCRVKSIRQLSTAIGDGCVAGITASAYVSSLNK